LFPNKDELYNLVSYVRSAKKKDVRINEIPSKLRRIGWKPQQIKYVLEKYSGKKKNLFDFISFNKIFGKLNKKNNQQISTTNTRFRTTKI
jgi:hypothetical protein